VSLVSCFRKSMVVNRRSEILRGQRGLTLVELIFTVTIVSILSMAALPLARVSIKRQKEVELRRASGKCATPSIAIKTLLIAGLSK